MTTGSTPPHRARPSAQALDAAFEANASNPEVRAVHALYVDACVALIRTARRMEATAGPMWAAGVEALVVLCEQRATRHIEAIALRVAMNGGGS